MQFLRAQSASETKLRFTFSPRRHRNWISSKTKQISANYTSKVFDDGADLFLDKMAGHESRVGLTGKSGCK
jgi:hypothetical protein